MTSESAERADAILGALGVDFYATVGRIVCVAAVLEQRVAALRHALAKVEQGKFTHQPVTDQIKAARRITPTFIVDDRARLEGWLDRVGDAFERRNGVVHSSFPAQADGTVFGHRPKRDKAVIDGSSDVVIDKLDGLRSFVCDLAALVDEYNSVSWIANAPRGVESV